VREIARRIGRAASTLSRELRRNAATRGGGLEYRATAAQWHADRAARRPKLAKLAVNAQLRDYVQDRLAGRIAAPNGKEIRGPSVAWKGRRTGPRQDRRWARAWSPEQIARRLRLDFSEDETMRISHEAIYQSLYIQGSRCAEARADRLPAHRAGAADAALAPQWAGQILRHARGHDQRTSG
jgi:IS30 family transposase